MFKNRSFSATKFLMILGLAPRFQGRVFSYFGGLGSVWLRVGFGLGSAWVRFGFGLALLGFAVGRAWFGLGSRWPRLGLAWVRFGFGLAWLGSALGWAKILSGFLIKSMASTRGIIFPTFPNMVWEGVVLWTISEKVKPREKLYQEYVDL